MPVELDINEDDAAKVLNEIDEQVGVGKDEALDALADDVRQNMIQIMYRKGNVSSGRGIRSLHQRKAGENARSIWGLEYLEYLDKGTRPHIPEVGPRLRFWARTHGWNTQALVDHIATYGTKKYPFINASFERTRRKAPQIVRNEVMRRLQR